MNSAWPSVALRQHRGQNARIPVRDTPHRAIRAIAMKTIGDFVRLLGATVFGALLGTAVIALLVSIPVWIVMFWRPADIEAFIAVYVGVPSLITFGTIFGTVFGWKLGTKWNSSRNGATAGLPISGAHVPG